MPALYTIGTIIAWIVFAAIVAANIIGAFAIAKILFQPRNQASRDGADGLGGTDDFKPHHGRRL